MKYSWSCRKFWKSWIKQDIQRIYYKLFFGWDMGLNGTMLPKTGKGKYVSVYRKGDIIQIIDEVGEQNEIRIIPCEYNHGVMVERISKDGKLICRNHLDIKQLNKQIIYAANVEKITK